MCGIIGYVGDKSSIPILLDGLKKLEYRGYDSAGICVCNSSGLSLVKAKGKIAELEVHPMLNELHGNIGIGHTRWATHGKPDEINAHPHFDCNKEIAIIHNGIIENYQALKELLIKEGHKFNSETDSEVLAHLVEKFYSGDLSKAVINALKCVVGTFGLAVVHKDCEEIVVARKSSPLIIGVGEEEMFVASDVPAILNHTKKVIYLNDDEVASIKKQNYSIIDMKGNNVDKKIYEIKWSAEEIEKGGFKHFMLKEIFEQPKAIENTLRGRLKDNKVKLSVNLDLNSINRIIIVACGTSWHSALIGKFYFEKLLGIPVEVDYASEFRYRDPIIGEKDLVIVISQSGETADTLAALKEAKVKKAKTLGIINVVGSTIAREVDSGIYLHAGPEIGVASTKAFSCQIIALLLLALYMRQEKKLEIDKELTTELENLPDKIRQVLDESKNARLIAMDFAQNENFLYLGRGINFPVALEGALKLKEISYIHAEGYPAAEMKHGPIALVDENMPLVFVSPKDATYEKILSNMQETKARGGKIIAITNEKDDNLNKLADSVFQVPKTHDFLSPLLNVIPLQLLAYYISDLKGLDVDKPRNLAKSVTVE